MVNGPNIINYICNFIVNHSFSVLFSFELFTYIISMVTLKSGIILDLNDDGPLKWANGPYPIQTHANYIILMDLLEFLWCLCKIWWAQESLISILEHNWNKIWIAYIWSQAKNKVHFSRTIIVFSQNGLGLSQDYLCQVSISGIKCPNSTIRIIRAKISGSLSKYCLKWFTIDECSKWYKLKTYT